MGTCSYHLRRRASTVEAFVQAHKNDTVVQAMWSAPEAQQSTEKEGCEKEVINCGRS